MYRTKWEAELRSGVTTWIEVVTRSAVVQPRSRVLGWRRPLFVAQDRVSQSVARSLSLARTTLLLTHSSL